MDETMVSACLGPGGGRDGLRGKLWLWQPLCDGAGHWGR